MDLNPAYTPSDPAMILLGLAGLSNLVAIAASRFGSYATATSIILRGGAALATVCAMSASTQLSMMTASAAFCALCLLASMEENSQ